MIEKEDGCADVTCIKHGFLARVILNGASVLCKPCGRWIRSESPDLRKFRDREREKKREQRAKAQLASQEATPSPL
jgi:hypothetical protein